MLCRVWMTNCLIVFVLRIILAFGKRAWRKRFCANNVAPTTIMNGKSDDNAILHEFTCYYSNILKPNTANADDKFRAEVEDRLTNEYHNTSHTPVPSIDVSSLLDHIGKLKKGKAAGLDGIVNEHILHGGECLAVHICLLFNAMTTKWLKLKYPTGQNAISRQPCQIFISKFLGLCGRENCSRIPATILRLKKIF